MANYHNHRKGDVCLTNSDCAIKTLTCLNGQCDCTNIYGYGGIYCDVPSHITIFSRFTCSLGILVALLTLMICLRALFLLNKQIRRRRSIRKFIKDIKAVEIMLYLNLIMALSYCIYKISQLATVSFDPSGAVENLMQKYCMPPTILIFNITHLQAGLVWIKACMSYDQVYKYHTPLKLAIFFFAICACGMMFFLDWWFGLVSSALILLGLMLPCSGVTVAGGIWIVRQMRYYGRNHEQTLEDAANIMQCVKRFCTCWIFMVVGMLAKRALWDNGWVANVGQLVQSTAISFFEIVLVAYVAKSRGFIQSTSRTSSSVLYKVFDVMPFRNRKAPRPNQIAPEPVH